jgi:hypothetical protein
MRLTNKTESANRSGMIGKVWEYAEAVLVTAEFDNVSLFMSVILSLPEKRERQNAH